MSLHRKEDDRYATNTLIGHGSCRTSLLILIRMNYSKAAKIVKTGSLHEGIPHSIHHDQLDLVLADNIDETRTEGPSDN